MDDLAPSTQSNSTIERNKVFDYVRLMLGDGMIEVEVFSNRWWEKPTQEFLQAIKQSYLDHT